MASYDIEKMLADALGYKTARKLSKKYKLKKWGPILTFILPILLQFFQTFFKDRKKAAPSARASQSTAKANTATENQRTGSIVDSDLQSFAEQALDYQREINQLVQASEAGPNRERLQELASQVDTWITAINTLIQRLDRFRQNKLIQKDMKSVPKSIARLEKKLEDETSPKLRAELEQTLSHRKNQQDSLEKLRQTMEWAEIKIESTLSMLGTIYSQILAGESKHHVADYRRLHSEVDEEVHSLQDYLEALDEVKFAAY